jgi:hypothetical protein
MKKIASQSAQQRRCVDSGYHPSVNRFHCVAQANWKWYHEPDWESILDRSEDLTTDRDRPIAFLRCV